MKKLIFTSVLSLTIFNLSASIGVWTSKAALSIARTTHVGFSLDGKGYICGGMDNSSNDLKDLWQYDPGTNSWSQKADMPGVGRRELSAFTVGNYAYVGHGRNVSADEIFYSFNRYDPSSNTWSAIASCPVQRFTSTGFSIDSIGYITCGILPGVARYKDLYAYNPRTNSWSQKAGLPQSALNRSYACVVSLNHKAYLSGGFEGEHMEDMYEYNPSNNTWTQKANFPGGKRNCLAGFALGNYVLMGMGRDGGTATYKDWYYYNPSDNTWTQMNSYPEDNSAGHATFVLNGKAYVCAGNSKAGTARNFLYELSAPQLGIESNTFASSNRLSPYKPEGSDMLKCPVTAGTFSVNVYDMSGRLVLESKTAIEQEEMFSLQLSELPAGQYTAILRNNSTTATLKFVLD